MYNKENQTAKGDSNMYEYFIINKKTGENGYIFGSSLENAFRRSKLNREEWTVEWSQYAD